MHAYMQQLYWPTNEMDKQTTNKQKSSSSSSSNNNNKKPSKRQSKRRGLFTSLPLSAVSVIVSADGVTAEWQSISTKNKGGLEEENVCQLIFTKVHGLVFVFIHIRSLEFYMLAAMRNREVKKQRETEPPQSSERVHLYTISQSLSQCVCVCACVCVHACVRACVRDSTQCVYVFVCVYVCV